MTSVDSKKELSIFFFPQMQNCCRNATVQSQFLKADSKITAYSLCQPYFRCISKLIIITTIFFFLDIFIDLGSEQKTVTLFQNLTDLECRISVIKINSNVTFLVIQTHTFNENITLSYNEPLDVHSYTTGTNIGLVWKQDLESKDNVATFYLQRSRDVELNILIIVTTYTKYGEERFNYIFTI